MSKLTRKEFLQLSGLATASLMVPGFLNAMTKGQLAGNAVGKTLVVIQMSGGNDGLNTVVPIRNDIYYKLRRNLAIKPEEALKLTDEAAFNPALPGFETLFKDGNMAILNTVGYPNPDRSHFRSMDIWQSASRSRDYIYTGWLGRYLDAECTGCTSTRHALEIDDSLNLAMKGEKLTAVASQNIEQLYRGTRERYIYTLSDAYKKSGLAEDSGHISSKHYLYKTLADTYDTADYLFQKTKVYQSTVEYPKGDFARRMKMIAQLICSDADTKIYYVSLGSFDTHVGQAGRQKQLLLQLSDTLTAFTTDLKNSKRFDDTLIMTFSEFGRRVAENASNGTDHGTANCLFLMSGGLKQKGILNSMPNLGDLDQGDLKYTIDFRDVYATVLSKWLGADDRLILGDGFNHLDFV